MERIAKTIENILRHGERRKQRLDDEEAELMRINPLIRSKVIELADDYCGKHLTEEGWEINNSLDPNTAQAHRILFLLEAELSDENTNFPPDSEGKKLWIYARGLTLFQEGRSLQEIGAQNNIGLEERMRIFRDVERAVLREIILPYLDRTTELIGSKIAELDERLRRT